MSKKTLIESSDITVVLEKTLFKAVSEVTVESPKFWVSFNIKSSNHRVWRSENFKTFINSLSKCKFEDIAFDSGKPTFIYPEFNQMQSVQRLFSSEKHIPLEVKVALIIKYWIIDSGKLNFYTADYEFQKTVNLLSLFWSQKKASNDQVLDNSLISECLSVFLPIHGRRGGSIYDTISIESQKVEDIFEKILLSQFLSKREETLTYAEYKAKYSVKIDKHSTYKLLAYFDVFKFLEYNKTDFSNMSSGEILNLFITSDSRLDSSLISEYSEIEDFTGYYSYETIKYLSNFKSPAIAIFGDKAVKIIKENLDEKFIPIVDFDSRKIKELLKLKKNTPFFEDFTKNYFLIYLILPGHPILEAPESLTIQLNNLVKELQNPSNFDTPFEWIKSLALEEEFDKGSERVKELTSDLTRFKNFGVTDYSILSQFKF